MTRKARIKSKFPNYKLSKEEKNVVRNWEQSTDIELIYTEEVVDKQSFIDTIERNCKWLNLWAQECIDGVERDLYELSYYKKLKRIDK